MFKKSLMSSGINRKNYNLYFNTGDIRWGKPSWLIDYKKFNQILISRGFKFFEMRETEYQDLNTIEDWNIAKKNLKNDTNL